MSNILPEDVIHALGPPIDWQYEMRREAQEILPSIYLEHGEAHLLKPRYPDRFNYITLDIRDATDQQLISIFPKAKEFIDHALHQNGRVLIHCGDGLSRSPAIMTAYVMARYNVSSEAAFQLSLFCAIPEILYLSEHGLSTPIGCLRADLSSHSFYGSTPSTDLRTS
ncbi:hypothetical protein PSTT_11706 [Puccinia striiformis]|uniref:Tyrosine specific protein phosphatases domain-containing protein n=1 Tax=Puccinia striiformis TaxID=27350 RepID=A0A2S4UZ89_9BASI|nr:hypothetical protein PSTT_11706 [Puccinia striiformis]